MNRALFVASTTDWLHRTSRCVAMVPMPPRPQPALPVDKTDLAVRAAYFAQSKATKGGRVAEIELPA